MIDVLWQILEQEGRTIKVIADLSQLPCRFRAKIKDNYERLQTQRRQIASFEKLQQIAQTTKELKSYFGKSQTQQKLIRELLEIYKQKVRQKMEMPILYYYQIYNPPLPRDLLSNKFKEMQEAIKIISQMVSNKKGTFICGEEIRVIDVLLYFDVCNLFYFGKNHSLYPGIKEWFESVYKVKAIRTITHQWFSMAKQISRSLRARRPKPNI